MFNRYGKGKRLQIQIQQIKLKLNKSVTAKIFFVTTILFIGLISMVFIFQSFFFERYYILKKKRNLENNVVKFIQEYNETKNISDVVSLIRDFEMDRSSKIAVLDSNGNIMMLAQEGNREDNMMKRIVSSIMLQFSQNNKINDIKKNNKIMTFMSDGKDNDIRVIVCVAPDNKMNQIVFAISSLQPVNEAGGVIKEFFIYLFLGTIFIILILAFLLSNMITKPLKKMNKTARLMADLDFSKKCKVDSEDEIGSLAKSLNVLSDNLDNALTSLKNANTKLEEDIERERKLEKMRKEFVASVSHELKTPVSVIEGYAEGIKDGIVDEVEQKEYVDIIIDEAQKMGRLVTDMLDVSQMESGSFKLVKEEFYLDELVNELVKKYTGLVQDAGLNLSLQVEKQVLVYADRRRLEQVITNFITNAVKYSDNRKYAKIVLKKENDKVKFEIENSCEKIDEEELKKIWDIFYKIDKSGNKKFGGTGIGLAIVKNIMQLHGGDCGAKNTENGVSFYFDIDYIKKDI